MALRGNEFITVVVLVLLLFLTKPIDTAGILERFRKFIDDFERPYKNNTDEFYRRMSIFQSNLEHVDRLNKAYGKENAVFGVTQFSDLTNDEFRDLYLSDFKDGHLPQSASIKFKPELQRPRAPPVQKIDWRDSGVVSAVKNQGQCGACWAFASAEVIESRYAISRNASVPDLSMQQLIDCAKSKKGANNGCKGGNICEALQYVAEEGITYSSQYPLTDKDGMCLHMSADKSVHITNYTCTSFENREDEILNLLATQGPVAAGVDSTMWNNYVSGVIRFHCDKKINHAVDIVGYDLTGSVYDVPYYIVRNSWGTSFGQNGYLYIEIGKNLCGIAERISTVDVS